MTLFCLVSPHSAGSKVGCSGNHGYQYRDFCHKHHSGHDAGSREKWLPTVSEQMCPSMSGAEKAGREKLKCTIDDYKREKMKKKSGESQGDWFRGKKKKNPLAAACAALFHCFSKKKMTIMAWSPANSIPANIWPGKIMCWTDGVLFYLFVVKQLFINLL